MILLFAALLAGILTADVSGQDFDRDGYVGFSDYLTFTNAFGTDAPGSCLQGVWISEKTESDGEDVSGVCDIVMSFDGTSCHLLVLIPAGPMLSQIGKYSATSSTIRISWLNGMTDQFEYEKTSTGIRLVSDGIVFNLRAPRQTISRME